MTLSFEVFGIHFPVALYFSKAQSVVCLAESLTNFAVAAIADGLLFPVSTQMSLFDQPKKVWVVQPEFASSFQKPEDQISIFTDFCWSHWPKRGWT